MTKKCKKQKGTSKYVFVAITILFVVAVGAIFNINSEAAGEAPLGSYQFVLAINGGSTGYFTEVTGIGSSSDVIEHKLESGGQTITSKIPGRLSYNTVTLKRNITSNKDMWDWRKQVEDGNITDARVDCSITALDPTMTVIAKWSLGDVWPSQITQKISEDGLTEEIVIVCESESRID